MRDPREDRATAKAPQLWDVGGPPGDPPPSPRSRLRPVPNPKPAPPRAERQGGADRLEGRESGLVLLLSVNEAARALGIGRSKTYELIAAGELETVHIGRAVRVPVDAVERFVDALRRFGVGSATP